MRDNSCYISGTVDGLILDCFTPENYIGMSTAISVIGHNISEYMSLSALKVSLDVLKIVADTERRFMHGFIMRFGCRINNRIITLFPGNEPHTVIGFIKSLNIQHKRKTGTNP